MAARDAVVLENHIKLFVETKLSEEVTVELHTGRVSIKPVNKSGSTTLGSFWVRVLQNYFPTNRHPFKKGYCEKIGSEILTVRVDDFTLTVYLRTGLVVCEGDYAYNWFKVMIRKIMDDYDRVTHSNTKEMFTDQIIFDTRKELQRKEQLFDNSEKMHPEYIDEELAFISSDVKLSAPHEKYISERTAETLQTSLVPTNSCVRPVNIPSGSLSLRDGERYIYPMWKQLLNKWLSKESCKVYISTPSIDVDRLRDVVAISYKNRLICQLEAIYTEAIGEDGGRMSKVRDDLIQGHNTSDEQLFIEYKVFNKIKFPATKRIGCNFIAGMHNDGFVEVLVTSATFDSKGFDTPVALHSVMFTKMMINEFKLNFLDKLATL